MTDDARAVIFGRDAETYDSHRPSYPVEAIDFIHEYANATEILEIGAGTGIATASLAGDGRHVTCLEPSAAMAAVLTGRGLPGVSVEVSTFEDWSGADESVDLIVAAQSWHWVDHETAYQKAMRLLRPGGSIALMWNVLKRRYDLFEDVYRKHAPQIIEERDVRIRKRDHHTWSDDLTDSGFVDVDRFTHVWHTSLDPRQYAELCSTYSDHMLIPEPDRTRLLSAIESAADSEVPLEYHTEVFVGRKSGG